MFVLFTPAMRSLKFTRKSWKYTSNVVKHSFCISRPEQPCVLNGEEEPQCSVCRTVVDYLSNGMWLIHDGEKR